MIFDSIFLFRFNLQFGLSSIWVPWVPKKSPFLRGVQTGSLFEHFFEHFEDFEQGMKFGHGMTEPNRRSWQPVLGCSRVLGAASFAQVCSDLTPKHVSAGEGITPGSGKTCWAPKMRLAMHDTRCFNQVQPGSTRFNRYRFGGSGNQFCCRTDHVDHIDYIDYIDHIDHFHNRSDAFLRGILSFSLISFWTFLDISGHFRKVLWCFAVLTLLGGSSSTSTTSTGSTGWDASRAFGDPLDQCFENLATKLATLSVLRILRSRLSQV